jgi:hypothetical protein
MIVASVDQIAAAKIRLVAETHASRVTLAEGDTTPALHPCEGVPLAAILSAYLVT